MNEYMVIIQFHRLLTGEFTSRIPAQRSHVNNLMEKGIITSYSLSADRTTLWMIIPAATEEEVKKTLRMMPLYTFMEFRIVELLFHMSPVFAPLHISMN